jgi:Tfp pilus assembly PilM family ATPase
MMMSHAGIDISDDAVHFIEYSGSGNGRKIKKYGRVTLPEGLIDGGDVKDEEKLSDILLVLSREHGLSYAKVSIPEEKAYLFETDVVPGDSRTVSQNIEFKLEENIPLPAADAVFAFDLLQTDPGKPRRASVSAVQRSYIESMIKLLRIAGINPVSFETSPRAIARIISENDGASIAVYCFNRKTGIYVVSDRAIGFTSTIGISIAVLDSVAYAESLAAEVRRVYAYWLSKIDATNFPIKRVVVLGIGAEQAAALLRDKVADIVPVEVADVWHSILDMTRHVPPIKMADSLEYARAAGLAL